MSSTLAIPPVLGSCIVVVIREAEAAIAEGARVEGGGPPVGVGMGTTVGRRRDGPRPPCTGG